VVKVAFIQKIIEPNLVAYYVEKNRFLLCSWLPTGTYHENVAIIWIFFLQNLVYLDHFSHEKSFE
jgi:hypothetical protein